MSAMYICPSDKIHELFFARLDVAKPILGSFEVFNRWIQT